MKISTVSMLFLFGMLFAPIASFANLGDSLSKAQARASLYKQKYEAVDPLFEVDSKGKVAWECWAAPPNMWGQSEALKLGRALLPVSLRKESPKKEPKDGSYYPYTFSDGTMIIISGYNGKYMGVEVRSPNFSGPRC